MLNMYHSSNNKYIEIYNASSNVVDKEQKKQVMDQFSIPGTIRASFAVYNSTEDVNRLVEGVKKAQKMLS